MDSLIEITIEANVIESMKTCYSESEINSIDNNPKDLIASILLLREIGVNEDIINKILIYDYHVLMPGRKALLNALSKIGDIPKFFSSLEEDITNLEYLTDID